jgi:adenylate cyclase
VGIIDHGDIVAEGTPAKLKAEIGRPLRVGIGLHAGPLLLGRIGYGEAVDLTVVGNAVNVASRLEAVAKQHGFQLVLSEDVARHAGCLDDLGQSMMVSVNGVAEPMQVVGVARGRDLPVAILAFTEGEDEKSAPREQERERERASA